MNISQVNEGICVNFAIPTCNLLLSRQAYENVQITCYDKLLFTRCYSSYLRVKVRS